MPFVNIRLIEGRSQQQKDEISTRVVDAISDVLQLPKDDIWVVFEDVPGGDWYVGSTTVARSARNHRNEGRPDHRPGVYRYKWTAALSEPLKPAGSRH